MRSFVFALVLAVSLGSSAAAATLADCAGVIRVFGDASSWLSACFVVGDGSLVVTTADAITEKAGPEADRIIRHPIFISAYTGQAGQCELKACSKDLNIAVLKLPFSGLPGAPLAQFAEFSKAAYGTTGQLFSGEAVGNNWPTEVYGVSRRSAGDSSKLAVAEWAAAKAFVTDMDKYKWLFVGDVNPGSAVPNGSMVARGSNVVGMYLNKLVITGGKEDVVFGRCAMSTEIARYMGDQSIPTAQLYDPPKATVTKPADAGAAFQLQSLVYALVAEGKAQLAVEPATTLAKMRPEDPQVRMMLGVALTGAGKFEDAIKAFDEASKLDPRLPTLRMNRALALIGLKKDGEAEAELLKAVEEAPTDSRPVTALADFYLGDEKTYDKALTYAGRATAMAPDSPAALLLAARVEKRKKNYQAAADTIGKALKMAPNWGDAWYALGATYEEAGDKDNAERAYRLLVDKQPKNPDSLLTLASFLADQGKKDEALEFVGKVRDLKPPKEVLDVAQALQDKIEGKEPAGTEPPAKD